MPKKTRECVICKKVEANSKKSYIIINSAESENKLRMGYWNRFGTDISAESLINSHAHKACYIKITRKLPPIKIQQQRVLKHSPLAKNGQNDVSLSKPVENPNAEEDTLEKEVTEINQSSTVLNNCDENVPDICSNEFSEIMYGSTTNGSSIAMCRKKVKGEIVAMSDIKITYENILSRRKEPYSPAILLGNAIRARLELKFGDYIFFYRRSNITSSFVRGEEAMRSYIVDRLINKTIKIDEPLTTMTFLKLSDADHYVPGERPNTKKKNLLNTHSRDLSKNLNSIDRLMRDAVIVAEQRNITLSSVFSHEFTIAPLSLCDLRDNNIMYQQNKSSIIDYIKSQFSTSFSSSPPSIHETQALIIDGRSILQIKPVGKRVTVRQYANQLLKMIIVYNFNSFNRIDVVFDSPSYDLKCDDVFDSDYHQLVMNNEAIIASRIRECWSASTSIQALPDGKVLVIAGPDESSVTLKKYCDPINDYLLVSNHAEAATRLFIHAQAISYENIKSIVCQSYDTDVIILGIAHALSLDVNNFFIKSFNTKGKFYTYINIREIALAIKKKFLIDPIILLVIHALSVDGISCAERLLLDCYSYTNTASSLDDLRATVASSSFKQNRASFVAPTLPPTSDAFYFHCQRAARQIQIWSQVYQSDMTIQTVENSEGYEIRQNDVQLKWLSLSCFPTDDRLSNSISTSRPLSQPVTSTPQKLKFTTITSRRAMTQENATTYEDISIVSFSPFQKPIIINVPVFIYLLIIIYKIYLFSLKFNNNNKYHIQFFSKKLKKKKYSKDIQKNLLSYHYSTLITIILFIFGIYTIITNKLIQRIFKRIHSILSKQIKIIIKYLSITISTPVSILILLFLNIIINFCLNIKFKFSNLLINPLLILYIIIICLCCYGFYKYFLSSIKFNINFTGNIYLNDISKLNETEIYCLFYPRTINDIEYLISKARSQNKTISIRGQAHTMGGQTLPSKKTKQINYVCDLKYMHYIEYDEFTKEVLVEAGATWTHVINKLNLYGRSPVVMQSYCTFSVAGTISVNAHGITSDHAMVESVISIEYIDMNGKIDECSREKESELFSLIIGGYGLFGIITRLRLKTVSNVKTSLEYIRLQVNFIEYIYECLFTIIIHL
ncbi:unnamed protein product [Rotaria sp. Silwood1]|nr:unnamed protein product [Rotaria sp. Silwood1]